MNREQGTGIGGDEDGTRTATSRTSSLCSLGEKKRNEEEEGSASERERKREWGGKREVMVMDDAKEGKWTRTHRNGCTRSPAPASSGPSAHDRCRSSLGSSCPGGTQHKRDRQHVKERDARRGARERGTDPRLDAPHAAQLLVPLLLPLCDQAAKMERSMGQRRGGEKGKKGAGKGGREGGRELRLTSHRRIPP